jgi:transcription initiation factor TFIIA small subunit
MVCVCVCVLIVVLVVAVDKIDEPTALQVLAQFDRSMYFALKAKAHTNLLFDGHLEEYRLVDSVWTWVLTDATLKFDGRTVRSPRVKIVATKAYEQQE